jgi:hypothetical protein
MKLKLSGVANLGAEELTRARVTVLTRARTRADAEQLFSAAAGARAKEQRKIEGLFVQADGAETMSPLLAKTAEARSFHNLASHFEKDASWQDTLKKGMYAGKSMVNKAVKSSPADIANSVKNGPVRELQSMGRSAVNQAKSTAHRFIDDPVGFSARKAKAVAHGGQKLLGNTVGKAGSLLQKAGDKIKYSSPTANVDAFFDKLAQARQSDAQRRYPELLKASAAPGIGTRPTPSLGQRVVSAGNSSTRGTTPSRAMLSGGAA